MNVDSLKHLFYSVLGIAAFPGFSFVSVGRNTEGGVILPSFRTALLDILVFSSTLFIIDISKGFTGDGFLS